MSESIEYEKLTQAIYQAINNSEGIKNIKVQHNIKIKGSSGCKHQIDVYWEFEIMGIIHKVAVECKNHKNPISIGKIRDFFGVLNDIGSICGIFVSKVGYQSGAIEYAKSKKISLQEFRSPTEKDWNNRVKNIVLNLTMICKTINKISVNQDEKWFKNNFSIEERNNLNISSDNLLIVDSLDREKTSFKKLYEELPTSIEGKEQKHNFSFIEDTFIKINNGVKVKILNISYIYNVLFMSRTSILEGESIVKSILKDINSGKVKTFNENNELIS